MAETSSYFVIFLFFGRAVSGYVKSIQPGICRHVAVHFCDITRKTDHPVVLFSYVKAAIRFPTTVIYFLLTIDCLHAMHTNIRRSYSKSCD